MLKLDGIHTYYGDSYILQGVNLEVENGMVVAVLGRNGVGKTTMIRSIVGFNPPRRGRISFDGRDITGQAPEIVSRLGISVVPQGRRIFGSLNVRENIDVASRRREAGGGWSVTDVFHMFPRLRERRLQKGRYLSGGEQQMLATARALVSSPRLMLMDEPTEGLSPLFVKEMARLIRTLKEQGTAVLLVEQNLAFALSLADRVHIMSKGQIVYSSVPDELRDNHQVKSRYLGL